MADDRMGAFEIDGVQHIARQRK